MKSRLLKIRRSRRSSVLKGKGSTPGYLAPVDAAAALSIGNLDDRMI
jgi:hypothetical protein